jgi:Flp pilus assembly protein TadD
MLHAPTRNVITVTLLALILSGCATLSGKSGKDSGKSSEYSELYDGDMQVAHEAGGKKKTAEQAIADGDRALALGDLDRAMFEYVRAQELSGGDATTLNKIGAIHARLGNPQLAARAYALSLKFEPENPMALEGIGLLLLAERNYDKARTYLESALKAEPGRWRTHNALGMLDDLAGAHEAAAGHYRQALEQPEAGLTRADTAQLWNNLGYSLYMAGDWKGALLHFQKSLNAIPEFERAWQNIGLVYTRKGQYDNALDAYLHVMDKPQAYNNIGYVCMINQRYDQAEKFFRQAIKLSPTYYVKAQENLDRLKRLRVAGDTRTD